MNGKPMLYIDQYGAKIWALSVRELREKCGGGRVSKQYVDGKDGTTYHTGYVVGSRWFTAFSPYRVAE